MCWVDALARLGRVGPPWTRATVGLSDWLTRDPLPLLEVQVKTVSITGPAAAAGGLRRSERPGGRNI